MSTKAVRPELEFETARLQGRWLSQADESAYVWLYTDAETMQFVGPSLSAQRAADHFRRALDCNRKGVPNPLYLALVEKTTGCVVGLCSLHRVQLDRRTAEAGIILLPAYQSRGYAKEGLAALVARAFLMLPMDEVRVRISAAHYVVRRLVLSIGFVRRIDLQEAAGSPDLQVWSVHRYSWATTRTINERGETDVGRDRLS